jgi:hypothetical protein
MEGITTAIVLFIFVCILFPRIVKHRTQFYTAFGLIIVMLLFHTLARMVGNERFFNFVGVVNGLLQLAALVLVVLATGGLSLRDLTGEFKSAIEVIRRGEDDKEIIVPLTGEQPKPRRTTLDLDDAPTRIDLPTEAGYPVQTPPAPTPPPGAQPTPPTKPADSTIPLE